MASETETTWRAGEARRPRLHALVARIGAVDGIDRVGDPVASAVKSAIGPGAAKDTLSGVPIGHPLHPALTDVVIGAWTSATLLDLLGGRASRPGADRLVSVGIAAAVPTALSGATDWADTIGAERRVGAVHAAANSAALACFVASRAARARGRRRTGVALSLVGAGVMTAGGVLGGHLSFSLGVGVNQTTFLEGPEEWTAALPAGDLREDEPAQRRVAGVDVVLVRHQGRVHALADRCSHRGGSLADGHLHDGCIACPLHHSTFRLEDGSVARGPATAPQPAFDVREHEGAVEIRARR